jgi:uncharacterized zinc-type alcohol dehydrogenase-like protein
MARTRAYAALTPKSPLAPYEIDRRPVGPRDVAIEIEFSGICHSDIHQARDEWGNGIFPMVPGHEIVGKVVRVGAEVKRFKAGDRVGVGCMVDSCRTCDPCKKDLEQFCQKGAAYTYNGTEMDRKTPTYGGYSTDVVVDEKFVLSVPAGLDPAGAAPLLCAGITTYSPLRTFGVKRGDEVAVVGLGGLGHVGVRLAAAMGARVTVFSHSERKRPDALALGASDFVATHDPAVFGKNAERFDFVLDTVSAPHDYNAYLGLLKRDKTMVLVGAPDPTPVSAFPLLMRRRRLAGSLIGGIRETQEMLDFCGAHGVVCDVEVIPIGRINEAWDRVVRSDVRYRFVIDTASLK